MMQFQSVWLPCARLGAKAEANQTFRFVPASRLLFYFLCFSTFSMPQKEQKARLEQLE